MVEMIKEEEGKSKEKYPWLDNTDERKYNDRQGNIGKIYRFEGLMS